MEKLKNKKIIILVSLVLLVIISIILFILFRIPRYTVQFDSTGGTVVKNQKVKEGNMAIRPSFPSKEGYVFLGWYLDDKLYLFDESIEKDITLIAKWTQTDYRIEVSLVDEYSPDRYITVYNGDSPAKVKKVMYMDDVEVICAINGNKITVSNVDIMDVSALKIILSNDDEVVAALPIENK